MPCWLLFTSLTAACARKSQNSDLAHVCLGFITQKQRGNTSRRQRVNSNPCCVTVHSVTSNTCTETAKQRFRAGCPRVCHAKNAKTPRGGVGVKSNGSTLLFAPRPVTHAQKPQNSGFAQAALGFVTQKRVKTPRGGVGVKSNGSTKHFDIRQIKLWHSQQEYDKMNGRGGVF